MKTLVSGFLFFALMITSHFGMTQVQVTVIQNNTGCAIPNGMASASFGGATTGYTFEWFDAALNYISSGATVSNLSGGNYNVIAEDDATSVQTMVQFIILDEFVLPEVVVESIPNTSCTAVSNGALITTVAGSQTDYSYMWYEGSDPQGSLISSDVHLIGRSAGGYTLQVTNLISSCYMRVAAQIADEAQPPLVNVVATSNTNCTSSPNGTLNAVTEEASQQYSFTWYTIDLIPLGITGHFATHLAAGNYLVTVSDGVTGCTSTTAAAINDDCEFTSHGFSWAASNAFTNEKKLEGSHIGYYPNPASETLWVSSAGPAALVLINSSGDIVLRQNVYVTDTAFALDVSGLKPGKYILKANESGNISNYQIIIKK